LNIKLKLFVFVQSQAPQFGHLIHSIKKSVISSALLSSSIFSPNFIKASALFISSSICFNICWYRLSSASERSFFKNTNLSHSISSFHQSKACFVLSFNLSMTIFFAENKSHQKTSSTNLSQRNL